MCVTEAKHPTDQDVLQLQALAWRGLGVALIDRGEHDEGRTQLRNAINYYDSVSGSSPAGYADALFDLARLYKTQGNQSDAIETLGRARLLYSKQIAADSNPQLKVGLATTLSTLGQLYELRGETNKATDSIRQAIGIWADLTELQADNPDYLEGLAVSFIDLANVQRAAGIDPEPAYQDGVDAYERLLEARPAVPRYRFNLATAQLGLALTRNQASSSDAVVTLSVEALNAFIELYNEYPDVSALTEGEPYGQLALAEILRDRGDAELALDYLQPAIERFEEQVEQDDIPLHREHPAIALSLRAWIEADQGSVRQRRESFKTAIDVVGPLVSGKDPLPRWKDAAAWIRFHLAMLLWQNGATDLAGGRFAEAIKLHKSIAKATPPILQNPAWLLLHRPDLKQRDPERARDLMILATRAVPENAAFRRTLGLAYLQCGDLEKCRAALDEVDDESDSAGQYFLEAMLVAVMNDEDQAQRQFDAGMVRMGETSPGRPRLIQMRDEAARELGINLGSQTPYDP